MPGFASQSTQRAAADAGSRGFEPFSRSSRRRALFWLLILASWPSWLAACRVVNPALSLWGDSSSAALAHLVLEWTAVCCSLFVGVLCVVQFQLTGDRLLPGIAAALAASGMLDALDALSGVGVGPRAFPSHLPGLATCEMGQVVYGGALWTGVIVAGIVGRRSLRRTSGIGGERGVTALEGHGENGFRHLPWLVMGTVALSAAGATCWHVCGLVGPWSAATGPAGFHLAALGLYSVLGVLPLARYMRHHTTHIGPWLQLSLVPLAAAEWYQFSTGLSGDGYYFLAAHVLRIVGILMPGIGLIAAHVDTFRSQCDAERSLRCSEERFHLAVSGSSDGLWDWYEIQREDAMWWSSRFNELLGFNDREIRPGLDTLRSLLHPDDRPTTLDAIRAHLEHDTPLDVVCRLRTRSHGYRWFLARARAVRDSAGHATRLAGSLTDIHDQKQQALELGRNACALELAQHQAAQASAAKSEFLANMSHEIRTPMTAILGYADVLLSNVRDPEHVEAVRTIRKNGDYLLRIINDVLDLSKIEAGKLDIERLCCSPAQILGDVVELMRMRAEEKKLELSLIYESQIPEVVVSDPTRLRQILFNLIGNAIKFTQRGGVQVAGGWLSSPGGAPVLTIAVRDTGIGMDLEQVKRLFRPFTQADASMNRRFGGTGLGLSISQRLAEMLGGTISVESEQGRGSQFVLTLPLEPLEGVTLRDYDGLPSRGTSTAPQPAAALHLRGRVLLVEDGPDNQRLLSCLLRKAGAAVVLAENGQEAVDLVLPTLADAPQPLEPFDIVLMDMQMPVLDGYVATERLRAAGYRGPIVALTAHAMTGDRQNCLDAGCSEFLAKPISREMLLDVVSRYLAGAELEESTGAVASLPVAATAGCDPAPEIVTDAMADSGF